MGRTTLIASEKYEEAILDYIEREASNMLVEKINNGKKTLKGCMDFVKNEAKKQAKNGMAMIEDKVVFGWSIHYFEEDDIKETVTVNHAATVTKKEEPKKEVQKKPVVEKKPDNDNLAGQMNIFDILGV